MDSLYARRAQMESVMEDSGQRHVKSRRVIAEARAGIGSSSQHVEPPIASDIDAAGDDDDDFVLDDDYAEDYDDIDTYHEDEDEDEDAQEIETINVQVKRGRKGKFVSSSSSQQSKGKASKDTSWILKGPVAGGPIVTDTLPSFLGHIASRPDELESREPLKCYFRPTAKKMLMRWYADMSDSARAIVDESGLAHLRSSIYQHVDTALISAFVERWQPDTNSFHMPFGEMTILLHDVYHILGIPVDGSVVDACFESEQTQAMVMEVLGLGPNDLTTDLYLGGGVVVKRLHSRCSGVGVSARLVASGWLWILLGSTLFVDTSGNRVRAQCVSEIRQDVHSLHRYSWGSATLANLYRALGEASRGDCKSLSGCLILLQAWIYEYFPCFRPHDCLPVATDGPRVGMWCPPRMDVKDAGRLAQTRVAIDDMLASEVIFNFFRFNKPNIYYFYNSCILMYNRLRGCRMVKNLQ